MPSDDIPLRMLVLLLELLKSGELPELAVGGAWFCVNTLMLRGSAALGSVALEADICGLAVAGLRAVGSPFVERRAGRPALLPVVGPAVPRDGAVECPSAKTLDI